MPVLTPSSILSTDVWVDHPQGPVFTRIWSPASNRDQQATASPIVLFHDSLGCIDLWRDFPIELSAATGRNVIAYDRPGFGRSTSRTDKLHLDFVADEAHVTFPALRQQLGFRRFIALGHSVGGGMAVHCAARFAADCEALITESAQVFPEERTLDGIRVAREQFKDQKQVERLRKYHGEKAEWVLDAWIGTWLDPAFTSWSLADVLPGVTCPVLAIHGDHDEYGSTRHPEMIGQLCGGPSRIEIIANTGHVPHREQSGLIVNLVSGFILSVPAS